MENKLQYNHRMQRATRGLWGGKQFMLYALHLPLKYATIPCDTFPVFGREAAWRSC